MIPNINVFFVISGKIEKLLPLLLSYDEFFAVIANVNELVWKAVLFDLKK